MTTLNVYAINRTTVRTAPRTEGILTAQIKKVLSTRDVNGKWIGTNKPSNHSSINTQVIVAKDDIAADTDNYYDDRTVAQVITAINS